MWDLPGPGIEPMSPALAGGFLTTAPPGKPENFVIIISLKFILLKISYRPIYNTVFSIVIKITYSGVKYN